MYNIQGDGSFHHTVIHRDGKKISWKECEFRINQEEGCVAVVDGVHGKIDRMILSGVYMIISEGQYNNTRLFYMKEMLHGIQWVKGIIKDNGHPQLTIGTILLPNLVELKEDV
jgi:hypothetical protein